MKKDGKKTRLQWLKEGRAVKEGAVGEECYTGAQNGKKAVYYGIEQTTADKRKVAKAKSAEKARKDRKLRNEQAREERRRLDEIRGEGYRTGYHAAMQAATGCGGSDVGYEFLSDLHTAWQWVSEGFVPRPDADWGDDPINGYYYCFWWDVRRNRERAAELLESGPREVDRLPDGRPYDGRPWW